MALIEGEPTEGGLAVGQARDRAADRLGRPDGRWEAERLIGHVLGWSPARVLAGSRERLTPEQSATLGALVQRRRRGEPLAYLLNRAPFLDVDLFVSDAVLIPRPETEGLAEQAIAWCRRRLKAAASGAAPIGAAANGAVSEAAGEAAPAGSLQVLDVGTGSGALAVAIARGVSQARVLATDISPAAVAVAEGNVRRLDVADRVTVIEADLLPEGLSGIDLCVANLPYVGRGEIPEMGRTVTRYEPHTALFAPEAGRLTVRRLLRWLPAALAPGAAVGLELGWRQGPAFLRLARQAFPRGAIKLERDVYGRTRYLWIQTGAIDGAETGV